MDTQACIKICNGLLKGELSAIETYDQALAKYSSKPESSALRTIRQDHASSADLLKAQIIGMGGSPTHDAGAWGSFAKSVEGSSKLLGEDAAVNALLMGEKKGRKDYEEAVTKDEMLPDCKRDIEENLLPRQLQHIAVLERLVH